MNSKSLLLMATAFAATGLSADRLIAQTPPRTEVQDLRSPEGREIDKLIDAGLAAYRAGNGEESISIFTTALAKSEAAKDTRRQSVCYQDLGILMDDRGQISKALAFFQQALALREQDKIPAAIAQTLTSLGSTYGEIGETKKGLDALQRALAINKERKSDADIGSTLNSLGNFYKITGQISKALECYQESLELKEKVGEPNPISMTLNNLGILYESVGQYEQALECHERALDIRKKLGNPVRLANTYNNLGVLLLNTEKLDKARDYLNDALALRRKTNNPADIAETLNNLGNLSIVEEKWDKALEYHLEALHLTEIMDDAFATAMSENNISIDYSELGQTEKSIQHSKRALAFYEKSAAPIETASALGAIGEALAKAKRNEEAVVYNLKAIDLMEKTVAELDDPSEIGAFQQANLRRLYAVTADLASRSKPDAALSIVERGRAQGLARQILGTGAIERLLPPEDRDNLRSKQTEIGRAAARLRAMARRIPPADPVKKKEFEEASAQAWRGYSTALISFDQTRASLFAKPNYADIRRISASEPPKTSDLIAISLKHPDTLYVELSLLKQDAILRITLQNGKQRVKRIECNMKQLKDRIEAWRKEISRADAYDHDKEESLAQQVHATLMTGVAVDGVKHAVVIAESGLLDIPYAALRDEKGRRLIDLCSVSSAFSIASLSWASPSRKPNGTMLCLADPTGSSGQGFSNALRGGFAPLPRARQEGKAISAIVPRSTMLVGPQAHEATVKAEMGKYDLLHFATHGVADSRNGMMSCLILAPEPLNSTEDGMLTAEEIAGIPLKAQLAVLSGCETARGQISGGEGLLGLSWAFRAAGVPAIIASQWRVDDIATETLMIDLYRGLRAGQPKDVALRSAMFGVRAKHANPFYWAAFQQIGDSSPLTSLKAPN